MIIKLVRLLCWWVLDDVIFPTDVRFDYKIKGQVLNSLDIQSIHIIRNV